MCSTGLLGHFRPSHPLTREELESHGIWDFDRQALLAVQGERPQRMSLQPACGVLRPALSRIAMDANARVIKRSLSFMHIMNPPCIAPSRVQCSRQAHCLCRLCNPYITTTILEDTFGELAAEVAAKYLIEYEKGRYRLKEEYTA